MEKVICIHKESQHDNSLIFVSTKTGDESAWREMWTSAWCVYSPYK